MRLRRPRRRLFFVALAMAIIGIAALTSCGNAREIPPQQPRQPQVTDGVLDLRGWDLETDGVVTLEGQWQFYWQQLLEPQDFSENTQVKSGLINIPSTWNRFHLDGKEIGGQGYATYRLTIMLENQDELLALKIPRIFTAYRLWIDGNLEAAVGQVGTDLDTMTPKYSPQVAIFIPGSESIEIVVQVSNFYHRSGGILEDINLGLESHIRDASYRALALEMFIVGSLFIMGFYHLGLFMFRNKELSSLVFGVYCLAIGIRAMLAGEIFFIYLFPNFNWEVAHNMQTLAFYLGLPLFVMFIRLIFPQDVPIKAVRFVQVGSFAFSLLVLFTPARIFTIVNPAFQVFFISVIPYFVYTLIKAVRNKRQGSLVIATGAIILILTTVNDVIFLSVIMNDYPLPILRNIITRGNMSSIGLLIFTFAQSLVLAMKFSTAFNRVEEISEELQELNRNLEEKVQERTFDLEKSNTELELAYHELHLMQNFRRDLLANVSHDLRSPMTTIKGYIDTILDGIVKDPTEQRQYLEVIREKTIGLDLLTRELFELTRLEYRDIELDFTAIAAENLLQGIYNKSRLDAEDKRLTLRLNTPDDSHRPVVNVDMKQIVRVFNNLIANSIRHTPENGTITIGFTLASDKVVFYIQDTGTGIDEDDLPNIFDRFYKGDKARSVNSGGSGLGLAIAKEIIEYHGGKIWVENNSVGGATFFFSLKAE